MWLSRLKRALDRWREPMPVYITPLQMRLYAQGRNHRWKRRYGQGQN